MLWDFGIDKRTHEFRFGWLLACLLGAILIPPYFDGSTVSDLVWKIGFSSVLIAAMYSVTGSKTYLVPTAILLIPTFATIWIDHFSDHNEYAFYLDNLTSIGFLSVIVFYFLRYILTVKRVTANVIYASMCVYLMFGLIWAAIYANLNLFYDSAFAVSSGLEMVDVSSRQIMGFFTYYSMVTLSTLGYGDIVPVNKVAQTWASVEAMVGQFYIAIVMARIVGIHIR